MSTFNKGDTVFCVPSGTMAIISDFDVRPLDISVADPCGIKSKYVYQIAWIYMNGEKGSMVGYPTSELTKTKFELFFRRLNARLKSAWYGFKNPQFRMS